MKYRLGQKPPQRAEFAQAKRLRDFAFLDLPWSIQGIDIRVMTIRDMAALLSVESPFLCGGPKLPADIGVFLWFLSVDYTTDDKPCVFLLNGKVVEMTAREAFMLRIPELPLVETLGAIDEYLDFIFMDSPRGGSGAAPSVSFVARVLDNLMSEYGWTERDALSCPMPRVYQYIKAMDKHEDPKWDVKASGAFGRWLAALPEDERAAVAERVNAGHEVEIPDEFAQ